jgi:hypothetical protein
VSVYYELWASEIKRATYHTLGQALLGALWRSKKTELYFYVYKTTGETRSECVAVVAGSLGYAKF